MNTTEVNVTINNELIEEIKRHYAEHTFMHTASRMLNIDGVSFWDTLKYLPTDNLRHMLKVDLDKDITFPDAYQAWGLYGILRFNPYLITSVREQPSLCIRRDRFLHMFRGRYFQVSGTESGIVSYGRTPYNTLTSSGNSIMKNGLLGYMLWYMSALQLAMHYDNFREAFMKDASVMDSFVNQTLDYYGCNSNRAWSDISGYVTHVLQSRLPIEDITMQLGTDDGKVYSYIAVKSDRICIEFAHNIVAVIQFPAAHLGTHYDMSDEDDVCDCEIDMSALRSGHYKEIILIGVLAYRGIIMNNNGWYFAKNKSDQIDKLETVPLIASVNDLDKFHISEE